MNPLQKYSWFCVIIFSAAILTFLVLIPFIGLIGAGQMSAIWMAVWGPISAFYLPRKWRKGVIWDERNTMIHMKASAIAGVFVYLFLCFACMIPWMVCYVKGKECISIQVLPVLLWWGFLFYLISFSVSTLVLYGRERGDEQD